MRPGLEARVIHGRPSYRHNDMVAGTWVWADTWVDLLFKYVAEELKIVARRATGVPPLVNIPEGTISRIRTRGEGIPDRWLLLLHEFSGLPISELRVVANLPSPVVRHKNARKEVYVHPNF